MAINDTAVPVQPAERLFNRNLVLLWQGQFVSALGNEAFTIAMVFYLKETTGSATMVGLLLMLSGLAAVITGPIGGTFADRVSRRKILLITDSLSGLAVLVLAGLMLFTPTAIHWIIPLIFVVTILLAVFSSFFDPAITAAVPDIVPENQVARANSLLQFSLQSAMLLGQGLGGVLYRLLSAPFLVLFNGLSFLFSAFTELFIHIPQPSIARESTSVRNAMARFSAELLEGLRYVWGKPGLRGLVVISALSNSFMAPIIVLLPFYIEDVLLATPDWYGFLLAGYSVGTMLGFVLAGAAGYTGRNRARAMIISMLLEAALIVALALTSSRLPALVFTSLAGLASGFSMVYLTTLLQITTPSAIRGRVFGLLGTIAGSLTPLAAGIAGLVADLIGGDIPLIYQVCGAIIVLLTLLLAASSAIRRFMAYEKPEEDD